jgi:hypothetical protein
MIYSNVRPWVLARALGRANARSWVFARALGRANARLWVFARALGRANARSWVFAGVRVRRVFDGRRGGYHPPVARRPLPVAPTRVRRVFASVFAWGIYPRVGARIARPSVFAVDEANIGRRADDQTGEQCSPAALLGASILRERVGRTSSVPLGLNVYENLRMPRLDV